jgi:hypothetical protein
MPLEEPKAVRSKQAKALRTPEKSKEISDSMHIAKAFHSPLPLKSSFASKPTAASFNSSIMAYAASERNSTVKDDGTNPAAAPRDSNSRTARRPSSP